MNLLVCQGSQIFMSISIEGKNHGIQVSLSCSMRTLALEYAHSKRQFVKE